MISDARFRTCSECHQEFAVPRTPGRPPSRCSDACRAAAARRHRREYDRRLLAARDQLAALLAA